MLTLYFPDHCADYDTAPRGSCGVVAVNYRILLNETVFFTKSLGGGTEHENVFRLSAMEK